MLSTLLELLWQRLKKKKEIPHRYVILSQAAVHWQQSQHCRSTILQSSIGKRLKHRKETECLLSYLSPWLGMQSHPWKLSRLGSHSQTGVGLTQPGTVPFVEPFFFFYFYLHLFFCGIYSWAISFCFFSFFWDIFFFCATSSSGLGTICSFSVRIISMWHGELM